VVHREKGGAPELRHLVLAPGALGEQPGDGEGENLYFKNAFRQQIVLIAIFIFIKDLPTI
jgi:hypothetical protein